MSTSISSGVGNLPYFTTFYLKFLILIVFNKLYQLQDLLGISKEHMIGTGYKWSLKTKQGGLVIATCECFVTVLSLYFVWDIVRRYDRDRIQVLTLNGVCYLLSYQTCRQEKTLKH